MVGGGAVLGVGNGASMSNCFKNSVCRSTFAALGYCENFSFSFINCSRF